MNATYGEAGVRRATHQDADAIGTVQAAIWHDAYAADLPADALAACTPQAFADAWRASLIAPPSPAYVLLVAHAGDAIVGLAALGPSDDPDLAETGAAELLVLGVDPGHRRQGHGSRLLAAAVDLCRERGVPLLAAWVLAGHEGTRAFLQGAGFGPDRARRHRVVDPDGGTVLEARLVTQPDPRP